MSVNHPPATWRFSSRLSSRRASLLSTSFFTDFFFMAAMVLFEKGAWWAEVRYRLLHPGPPPEWEEQLDRLGPFKRPRNAMVESERHLTALRNRHGDSLRVAEEESAR